MRALRCGAWVVLALLMSGCPSESTDGRQEPLGPGEGGAEPTVLDEVVVPGDEAAAEAAADSIDEGNVLEALDELEAEIGGD
jgi:hypothetical protein